MKVCMVSLTMVNSFKRFFRNIDLNLHAHSGLTALRMIQFFFLNNTLKFIFNYSIFLKTLSV